MTLQYCELLKQVSSRAAQAPPPPRSRLQKARTQLSAMASARALSAKRRHASRGHATPAAAVGGAALAQAAAQSFPNSAALDAAALIRIPVRAEGENLYFFIIFMYTMDQGASFQIPG